MPGGHETELVFDYDDPGTARTVADSVRVEAPALADDRSDAAVEREARRVRITIRAADLVALRAAANTWCSLAGVAERAAETA